MCRPISLLPVCAPPCRRSGPDACTLGGPSPRGYRSAANRLLPLPVRRSQEASGAQRAVTTQSTLNPPIIPSSHRPASLHLENEIKAFNRMNRSKVGGALHVERIKTKNNSSVYNKSYEGKITSLQSKHESLNL